MRHSHPRNHRSGIMSDLIPDSDVGRGSGSTDGLYPVFDIKDQLIGWRRFPPADAWTWTKPDE
jgi:hypothetical protein